MPRQPYPSNYPKPIYGIAHPERMTDMNAAVGRCIMLFSYVEWQMALILAAIMKADSQASIAIFLTLRNARAQREVLAAAAQMTLADKEKEAFDALVAVYGGLQAQRADIAHGIFGEIPNVTDRMAWIETKDLSKNWVEKFHGSGISLRDLGLRPEEKERHEEERLMERSSIYKVTDLDILARDIKELWEASFHFYVHLRYSSTEWGSESFEKLCNLPQIAAQLSRMRNSR